MPKTFSKQYFATASGAFNSVASFNFCTKCHSHFCVWQTPVQPWSTGALWLPSRSQVFVGEVRQSLATDFSCDWEIVPVKWRRKGLSVFWQIPRALAWNCHWCPIPRALEPSLPSVWSNFWPSWSLNFNFLPQIWPIKERFTTSNHCINTIADLNDSQSANTGWSCPKWGGEEISQCFLCKWQKDRAASSEHFHGKMDPWTQDCSRPSGKRQLWISAQISLRIFQGAATAALASQVQAGFYSTFSLWDEATSHLAPWALLSWRAPVNDPLHLGDCWAKVQIQSCHLTTITPFSGNWSVFLWALNKHDIVHVTKYVE